MGVYAHRFIEVLDKDNKWKALPLWNKHEEDSYGKPDVIVGELKLKKHLCFLQRASSGFYSTASLLSEDDISHSISSEELSVDVRAYVAKIEFPINWHCFSLAELEAFADKCEEHIYSNLADAFHDRNMQLIVKMLASIRNERANGEENEDEDFFQSPRATYGDYMEDYLSVVSELSWIHFIIHEVYSYYSSDMIRVVFFYG
ncbi:MAG: hypothetical protein K5945_02125 [Bacteroidaceae bacterium]|nr:hypothetical protein [Bacteroidaceae bacterium]